jgi:hypothetical protein
VTVSRLGRFLRIERPRAARPAAPARRADTAARFGTVAEPAAPAPAPAASGPALDRFAPPPPAGMELAPTPSGERPFTRCMRCGMDHHVLATECGGCGESLVSDEQRAFNERLWAERREEDAREAEAAARLRAAAGAEAAELDARRRAMAEELAREVGRQERLRLDAELGAGTRWDGLGRALLGVLRFLGRRLPPPP